MGRNCSHARAVIRVILARSSGDRDAGARAVGARHRKCLQGRRLLLSKSAVSQLAERLWEDYRACTQRDLSEYGSTVPRIWYSLPLDLALLFSESGVKKPRQ